MYRKEIYAEPGSLTEWKRQVWESEEAKAAKVAIGWSTREEGATEGEL